MNLKELLGDNYKEGMTFEEIELALQGVEPQKTVDDTQVNHLKSLLSKANGEASKYKKQLQEKMTQEELEAEERRIKFETMENELAELKKQKQVSESVAQLVSSGYNEETAKAMAVALNDGDLTTALATQKSFLEEYKKAVISEALKKTPRPQTGSTGDEEKPFSEMSMDEKIKLKNEDPELYAQLRASYRKKRHI